jgi:hypothetical protein
VATLLLTALLLLHDVIAVMEMMCLPSHSLATAVSLAPLFHLSGVMSQILPKIKYSKLCVIQHSWGMGSAGFFFGGVGLTSPGTEATSGLLYSPR